MMEYEKWFLQVVLWPSCATGHTHIITWNNFLNHVCLCDCKDMENVHWGAKLIFFWTPASVFYTMYLLALEKRNKWSFFLSPLTGQTSLRLSQGPTLLLCREARGFKAHKPAPTHRTSITSTNFNDKLPPTKAYHSAPEGGLSPQLAFLIVKLHWEIRTRSFHTIYSKKPSVRFYDPFQKKHKP